MIIKNNEIKEFDKKKEFINNWEKIEKYLESFFTNEKMINNFLEVEESIHIIYNLSQNMELFLKLKRKLEQIFKEKIEFFLEKDSMDLEDFYWYFLKYDEFVKINKEIFSNFTANFFENSKFRKWTDSILDTTILNLVTDKIKFQKMFFTIIFENLKNFTKGYSVNKNFITNDSNFIKIRKIFKIIDNLQIMKNFVNRYKEDYLTEKYFEKIENRTKNEQKEEINLVYKFFENERNIQTEIIQKLCSKIISKEIIIKFDNYFVTNFVENLILSFNLFKNEENYQKCNFLLEIFSKTDNLNNLRIFLIEKTKAKLLSFKKLDEIIHFLKKQRSFYKILDDYKSIEKSLKNCIKNTLNNEKEIDPYIYSLNFHNKIVKETFSEENFYGILKILNIIDKNDKFFEELFKRFVERIFYEDTLENDLKIIKLLEKDFGKDKMKNYNMILDDFKKNFFAQNKIIEKFDIKIFNKKIWPFGDKDKLKFSKLPSPFWEFYNEKKIAFKKSNKLLDLNFKPDYNICELDLNFKARTISVRCDLIQALLLLSFNNGKKIDLTFLSFQLKIDKKIIENKLEEINKKIPVELTNDCMQIFLDKIDPKLNFLDLIPKNYINEKETIIKSIQKSNETKKEILKSKKKILKAIITKTIKDEKCCSYNLINKNLQKYITDYDIYVADYAHLIEELIDSDIIERDKKNENYFIFSV